MSVNQDTGARRAVVISAEMLLKRLLDEKYLDLIEDVPAPGLGTDYGYYVLTPEELELVKAIQGGLGEQEK